jgi:excisionase family DNA binding protein
MEVMGEKPRVLLAASDSAFFVSRYLLICRRKKSYTKAGGNGNLISVLVDLNETEEEKMEAKGEPRLLRAEEVVKLTGWSRAKVYAMAGSGELPALRSGRSVRIPLAALEKWIEQNTTGGTQ